MSSETRSRYDLYLGQTPAQTLGPFFHHGLFPASSHVSNVLAGSSPASSRVRIKGGVYDGAGRPVPDALLEIWQADERGVYAHPLDPRAGDGTFDGFGRAATDALGKYFFETIKPGPVPGPSGSVQAPHLNLILGARGMARLAFTRVYFEGDAELACDPALSRVPLERRGTLLARRGHAAPDGVVTFRHDLRVQGEGETVFFEF